MIQDGGPGYETADTILAALVQVLVDPYFRTVQGFLSLIVKEWFLYRYAPSLTPFFNLPSSRQYGDQP